MSTEGSGNMADDIHSKAMLTLCRICGQRWRKSKDRDARPGMDKNNHTDRLLNRFGVDISNDSVNQHPKHVCKCCIADLNKSQTSVREVIVWNTHIDGTCRACEFFRKTAVGGRKKKPQQIAANKRMKRKREVEEEKKMEEACNILLSGCQSQEPPSKKIKLVASTIIRKILKTQETPTIELPTGGPKLVLKKISTPKKSSHQASSRTVSRRNKEITTLIRELSSTSSKAEEAEEAEIFQLAALLKGKSKEELTKVIREKGLDTIRIPAGEELAMKAKMGWSWAELRVLKRWLKAYKIKIQCEGKTREKKSSILQNTKVQSELLPFFVKEGKELVTRLAPMVWIQNLKDHIIHTLDELQRTEQMTWANAKPGEIWLKIGADKGGGSVKIYYQLMNVAHPNSASNTTVFCAFQGEESVPNLHLALDLFVDEINSLMESKWRDMPIVLFLAGDLEILRKLLGLQGTSAMHPCVFCTSKKNKLDSPSDGHLRSIDEITKDHSKVAAAGNTTKAKQENNSVNSTPFFNIPIEHVCPPSLHISLGLWDKFFTSLEGEVQNLGQVIADDQARNSSTTSQGNKSRYFNYIDTARQVWAEIADIEKEAEDLRGQIVDAQYSLVSQGLLAATTADEPTQEQMDQIEKLQDQVNTLDAKVRALKDTNKLPKLANPLMNGLDRSLSEFKVRRQASSSCSFVGNHVKKCLKPENYNRLLDTIVNTTKQLTANQGIWDLSVALQLKYLLLFQKFERCFRGMSHARSQAELTSLSNDIEDLVTYYKSKFPLSSFTPKFHILFRHVVSFVSLTGVPLAIMGEQGGECLHSKWNQLRKQLVGILNTKKDDPELVLLQATLEEHLIIVHPTNRNFLMEE